MSLYLNNITEVWKSNLLHLGVDLYDLGFSLNLPIMTMPASSSRACEDIRDGYFTWIDCSNVDCNGYMAPFCRGSCPAECGKDFFSCQDMPSYLCEDPDSDIQYFIHYICPNGRNPSQLPSPCQNNEYKDCSNVQCTGSGDFNSKWGAHMTCPVTCGLCTPQ